MESPFRISYTVTVFSKLPMPFICKYLPTHLGLTKCGFSTHLGIPPPLDHAVKAAASRQ